MLDLATLVCANNAEEIGAVDAKVGRYAPYGEPDGIIRRSYEQGWKRGRAALHARTEAPESPKPGSWPTPEWG